LPGNELLIEWEQRIAAGEPPKLDFGVLLAVCRPTSPCRALRATSRIRATRPPVPPNEMTAGYIVSRGITTASVSDRHWAERGDRERRPLATTRLE